MIAISVLGYGNLASHLVAAFEKVKSVNVIQIYNRHPIKNKPFNALFTTNLSDLLPADIYIIAIPDDAISVFSSKLKTDGLVVHTSGSVPLEALQTQSRAGVFYPLQSFTKGKAVSFKNIPICIEATDKKDLELLFKLARSISDSVIKITTAQRKKLHVAAVFVNNFTNYMYTIGESLCEDNKIDFNILKPLILETALKIETVSPHQAQTGPARRKDVVTIKKHLDFLPKEYQEIYTLLTQSIQKNYDKKL
ncbi:MAG: DUF2520 domain-containing protein [Flavobacteriales bacterium CG_4_8_14_3_um_filter_35_10]|nr:DUF2520 domain-containing protein [Zetaproteobacteria bacterium]PIR14725.1 MAG: hypothetical protein COV50_01085 [Flavobacteriales bacterium CG11_big_fil_rev_8_21_14_0_20_35_7]PIX05859.1 MAG: DUF2520 domain-containing protein [Flavobacteriales bacterium CG_4_8_14_3_um_filter_35_10]